MDISASPELPEPEEIHTMVVYDAKTGVIVHRHHVVTYPGAQKKTKEQLDARAIEMAKARTDSTKPLAVLHAAAEAFTQPVEYKVDVKKKRLVKVRELTEKPPRRKKKAKRRK
ncbi:MAG: hypothetical protein L0Y72_15870 [Gemmataceae bacterium]|nr:hypothetical protein [Gemmataceae bacterium]MCI0740525.1 hypothetical protein [Gemmataceae bacterium]